VKAFRPGDEVFGEKLALSANTQRSRASNTGLKPSNMTFEQAASAPMPAFTALQALRDEGRSGRAEGSDQRRVGRRWDVLPCRSRSHWARKSPPCAAPGTTAGANRSARNHVIDYTKVDFTQGTNATT